MKVIKRDGKIVEYEREKIKTAIHKANVEVSEPEKATEQEIHSIITYIESLGKKRILVEDIQDIIELKLMELGHYELAKKYIVYRYTRTLVRKQTSTDSSILGMIKKTNQEVVLDGQNKIVSSMQRDLIAGEVSKDLTKRILLPEKIVRAMEDGVLHFLNSEYYVQPIFHSSLIDIEDMLENGTVIQGKKIESPKSFQVACTVLTQIVTSVSSSSYGGVCLPLSLGKYLRKSMEKIEKEKRPLSDYKKELISGVQTLIYQMNTSMNTSGKIPYVTLILENNEGEYQKENLEIMEELLKQKAKGMLDENGNLIEPEYPKIVYVLDKSNCLHGGKHDDLTKLTFSCNEITYLSKENMEKTYGKVTYPIWKGLLLKPSSIKGRFHQGMVSLNLPQIAILADGVEETFYSLLRERVELCLEALLCRHYALLGTYSDMSPILWKYGAISRLKSGEMIDSLLKNDVSNLSLCYVGLQEVNILMKKDLSVSILEFLKETCEKWSIDNHIEITLYGMNDSYFVEIDREKFGKIKGVTDRNTYTNIDQTKPLYESVESYNKMVQLSSGGMDLTWNFDHVKELIQENKLIYWNVRKEK